MKIHRLLSESITHIEDLPVDRFIDVLKNLSSMTAQEKLDGANVWVGVDEDGRMYTSREGKRANADRKYSPDDWSLVSANNQFRAAHAALQQYTGQIKQVLQPGDTVEVEVLFGRQPNSVTYGASGKSYVAFLRGVNETSDDKALELAKALDNKEAEAKVKIVDTQDGEQIDEVSGSFPFQFVSPHTIDSAKLAAETQVQSKLDSLEKFLQGKSQINSMTNWQLMSVNLQQVPKENRASVKQARAELMAEVQTKYKLPIKQVLLDKVTTKSKLADDSEDGIGIEGIVLRDPETGDQIKIVDKDVFTTINKFNQHPRQIIQSALNTVDPDSPVESRGGLLGQLRINIAELLGNRELAKASNARKAMEPFKGDSPEQTIKNFVDSMKGIDDYQAVKKKILAMTAQTAQDLKTKLQEFKDNRDAYLLKLKNGKEIGLSDDVVKRTLLTFAEAKKNLTSLFDKIKATKSLAQLIAVLYGSQAKILHQTQNLEESLVFEKSAPLFGDISKDEYKKDTYHLLNSYLAVVLLSTLVHYENDVQGLRFLRDRAHMMLKSWSDRMSPLNHWGYAIWRNTKPDVKKILDKKTQAEVHQVTKAILPIAWKNLHRELSYSKDVKIHWEEHHKMLLRLVNLAGLRSDRLNRLLDWIFNWPTLAYDDKVKALNGLYLFSMRFVPKSVLFVRLRIIQQNLLLNATGMNDQMVTEGSLLKTISSLTEEGEGGDVGADTQQGHPVSVATTSANVASLPVRVGNRQIIKRKRNPESVKRLTMKFPDPRKDQE